MTDKLAVFGYTQPNGGTGVLPPPQVPPLLQAAQDYASVHPSLASNSSPDASGTTTTGIVSLNPPSR